MQINSSCSVEQSPDLYVSPQQTGVLPISLRAEYNGCFTEVTNQNAVKVKGPIGKFDFTVNCASSYDYVFEEKISGATHWYWQYGNDTQPTDTNISKPLHHFDSTANYTVVLVSKNDTSGCKDYVFGKTVKVRKVKIDTLLNTILCPKVPVRPSAEMAVDYNDNRNFEPFAWYLNGTGLYRDWLGEIETFFKDTGRVVITIVAVDENLCTDTLRQEAYVRSPKVKIESNKDYLCGINDTAEFRFSLYDSTIVRWMWDFDDFKQEYQYATDSVDSVLHAFAFKNDRMFNVMVQVQDSFGCWGTDTLFIDGYYKTADFTMKSNNICFGYDTAQFFNVSTDLDSSFWHLGDTSFVTNDTLLNHIYKNKGVYPIIHVGYYKTCKDSVYWKDSVGVGTPDASFFASDTLVCTKELISFHLENPLHDAFGLWTFTDLHPTPLSDSISYFYEDSVEYYRYYNAGLKRIKLRLDYGSCVDSSTISVKVNGAFLTAENRNTCVDSSVIFRDTLAISDSYKWTIVGNEVFDTVTTSPFYEHTFAQRGNYSVRLIAITDGCNDTIVKTDYVNIQKVKADYTVSQDTICFNEEVVFKHAKELYDAQTGEWWFNDFVSTPFFKDTIFTQPYVTLGANNTRLVLRSSNGCIDEARKTIFIGGSKPVIAASPEYVCFGQPIAFSYTVPNYTGLAKNIEWVFGDGNTSSSEKPTHTYQTMKGEIFPKMVFTDSIGCRVPSDALKVTVAKLKAEFNFERNPICVFESLQTINTSTDAVENTWTINDSIVGNSPDLLISQGFSKSGNYNVKLVVADNNNCTSDTTQTLNVKPLPDVTIWVRDSLCVGDTISVYAQYEPSNTAEWFINGAPDYRPINPKIEKPLATTQYVVSVVDSFMCKNADTSLVFVQQLPQHIIPNDTIMAIGDTIHFGALSDVNSTFTWKANTTDISCTDCPNPKIYSFESNTYTLTISDWCVSREYEIFVEVIPTTKFDVPSAFTPNGDGVNDVLRIRGWGIKEIIEFDVYNRWGQLLYSSTEMTGGWDGTYRGKQQGMDTYVYKAKVKTFLNEELYKQGYVDLVR
ncbi:MAG: gliding motility-associated C-terminal domain-containing protein [Bacteroidales bacterium]|nr:gliding motility-associated C-terminal domain-containing protein [Bacteroidales bacterium]